MAVKRCAVKHREGWCLVDGRPEQPAEAAVVEPRERPILFNAEMVRAVRDGRKTQTRRVIKPQDCVEFDPDDGEVIHLHPPKCLGACEYGCGELRCPYGVPGDRLWVRETHWRWGHWEKTQGKTAAGRPRWRFVPDDSRPIVFKQPQRRPPDRTHLGYHRRPSIFLPTGMHRIDLEVTEVRVERVRDISEDDAVAEGVSGWSCMCGQYGDGRHDSSDLDHPHGPIPMDASRIFADLWDSINKARGFGWEANPWVWVVGFKRVGGADA